MELLLSTFLLMFVVQTAAVIVYLLAIVKRLDVLIALIDDSVEFTPDDDDEDEPGRALAA